MNRHSTLYRNVMQSERWRDVRREALRRSRYRCERCGARGVRLDGHHWRGYGMLGRESPSDVMMLCARCHADAHGRRAHNPHNLRNLLIRLACFALVAHWALQYAGVIR